MACDGANTAASSDCVVVGEAFALLSSVAGRAYNYSTCVGACIPVDTAAERGDVALLYDPVVSAGHLVSGTPLHNVYVRTCDSVVCGDSDAMVE